MTDLKHGVLRDVLISPAKMAIWRVVGLALAAPVVVFILYTALRAISESWDNDAFPESLAVKLELLPALFPIHMVTGGLALILVPLTLLLRGTRFHKHMGRITAADVLIAGATAIPVAYTVPVTLVSAAGFCTQGVLWMGLCGLGIWHIRHGRVAQHRRAMLLMAAVTTGAMFFRIYLALWMHYGWPRHFKTFYALDAWIAWGIPFLVVLVATWPRGPRQALAAPR
jgi:Predicted membrane protein (DUF2306)